MAYSILLPSHFSDHLRGRELQLLAEHTGTGSFEYRETKPKNPEEHLADIVHMQPSLVLWPRRPALHPWINDLSFRPCGEALLLVEHRFFIYEELVCRFVRYPNH